MSFIHPAFPADLCLSSNKAHSGNWVSCIFGVTWKRERKFSSRRKIWNVFSFRHDKKSKVKESSMKIYKICVLRKSFAGQDKMMFSSPLLFCMSAVLRFGWGNVLTLATSRKLLQYTGGIQRKFSSKRRHVTNYCLLPWEIHLPVPKICKLSHRSFVPLVMRNILLQTSIISSQHWQEDKKTKLGRWAGPQKINRKAEVKVFLWHSYFRWAIDLFLHLACLGIQSI